MTVSKVAVRQTFALCRRKVWGLTKYLVQLMNVSEIMIPARSLLFLIPNIQSVSNTLIHESPPIGNP